MELAFDKAQHQAGLSHCRFAQQHQLKLADLVVGCRAVDPRGSASPCHSPSAEDVEGESRSDGRILVSVQAWVEGWPILRFRRAGSV